MFFCLSFITFPPFPDCSPFPSYSIRSSPLVGTFRSSESIPQELVLLPLACPGTQHSVKFHFRLFMSCLIFLVSRFFVWLLPDAVIMVLSESVNITPLTSVVNSFCIASMIANFSALNIDDWSLNLILSYLSYPLRKITSKLC
jgi:hypothetical protein